jgi:hypothetical protein
VTVGHVAGLVSQHGQQLVIVAGELDHLIGEDDNAAGKGEGVGAQPSAAAEENLQVQAGTALDQRLEVRLQTSLHRVSVREGLKTERSNTSRAWLPAFCATDCGRFGR